MESSLESRARAAVAECIERGWNVNNDSGWKLNGTSKGLEIWNMKNEIGIKMLKVVGVIEASVEDVKRVLDDISSVYEWDEMIKSSTEIASFSEDFNVLHQEFNVSWPVSNRDFTFVNYAHWEGDRMFLFGKSIDTDVQSSKGVVRGSILFSYFLLEPIENGTRVTYMVNVDPKGSVPKWIVNISANQQAQNVTRLKKMIEKK